MLGAFSQARMIATVQQPQPGVHVIHALVLITNLVCACSVSSHVILTPMLCPIQTASNPLMHTVK